MKTALKAVLLSGLVFPGLGHVAIKAYRRGAVLMIATLAFLIAFVAIAARMAVTTLEKIQAGGGAVDMDTVSAAAARSADASANLALELLLLGIVACWIFGVIDGFRLGRRADANNPKTTP